MLTVSDISVRFGKRVLFDEVNLKFTQGNCYGIIGANGAGKSTFLKLLTKEMEPSTGHISLEKGKRMAVLSQDHFAFEEHKVLDTVLMGHKRLWDISNEKEILYAKEDFTDEDGIKASELEEEFAELDGWNAESDAAVMLSGLGIKEEKHQTLMSDMGGDEKVRVLLAQALFGNPDLLIMDEPTNDLDLNSIRWLENFLADFKNTVLVVSHDRHFIDTVSTHVLDIDYNKMQIFSGNYSFWYHSSQLALRQQSDKNKKAEDKKKELQEFIRRFSANAAKSKQATSRKKLLEKLNIDEIKPSSRKYPHIHFEQLREAGDQILTINKLSAKLENYPLFSNISFTLNKSDKVALISKNSLALSKFTKVLAGEDTDYEGDINFGVTINKSYLPNDNSDFFKTKLSLVDWLRQYSEEKDETFIRGFLGRMLFSGEESLKSADVISGGEKVRCVLSKIMLEQPNLLLLDEPTSHLDLESIQAFNNGLIDYKGTLMFHTRDQEFMNTIANRVIEIGPFGHIDKLCTYEEYVQNVSAEDRQKLYGDLFTV